MSGLDPGSPSGPVSGPLTATLVSRSVIAPGVADLVFAMASPPRLDFRAGQFVSILVGKDPAGTTLKRSYSIASPSGAGEHLRFIIRVIPEGTASEFLMVLPIGGEVRMTGPHGFFVLEPEHVGDIVFGATGTGVSAVMPMLAELARRPARGRRILHWGARHEADLFARREIEALCRETGTELVVALTQPPADWNGKRGRITNAILDAFPELTAPTFYLVGNGSMIAELKAGLVARGVNRRKQIRTEAFFD
jgi:CDP-4-dehydro-6-deoxyglucose reductase, E3